MKLKNLLITLFLTVAPYSVQSGPISLVCNPTWISKSGTQTPPSNTKGESCKNYKARWSETNLCRSFVLDFDTIDTTGLLQLKFVNKIVQIIRNQSIYQFRFNDKSNTGGSIDDITVDRRSMEFKYINEFHLPLVGWTNYVTTQGHCRLGKVRRNKF